MRVPVEIISLLLVLLAKSVLGANVACQEVRYKYSAKGNAADLYDMPLTPPSSGSALQICPQGPTCCTPDMEFRLGRWSSLQYREAVNNKTTQMAIPFNIKANKMHDFMENLFDDSQRQFHEFFKKTYGVLYDKNSHVFREYFAQLRQYFYHGRIDLNRATDSFFANLYQKMFQVMNSQYTFDHNYLRCVAQHMDQIAPFGDVPRKMASSVRRSMLAARAMYKAVRSAYKIADKMKSLEPTKECLTAVQKMNSCPACQGYTELKPCSNYCINVMKGCLVFHIELQNKWDEFIDTLTNLGERLQGPLNLEMIILPLDIQISGAIMSFQELGLTVTQKVFQVCGTPKAGGRFMNKRSTNNEDLETQVSEFQQDHVPEEAKLSALKSKDLVKSSTSTRKSDFDKLISDLRTLSQDSRGFWRHLPYVMCDQPDSAVQERLFGQVPSKASDNDQCWNGKDSGAYSSQVVQDGLANLLKNPEMDIRSPLIEPALLREQSNKLSLITLQLRSAHMGQDVKWWDEEIMVDDAADDNDFEGSGEEGSGDADDTSTANCDVNSDDEDCQEQGSGDQEGSGDEEQPTETGSWAPWSPPSETTTISTTVTTTTTTTSTTTSTTTTQRTRTTAGSSNLGPCIVLLSVLAMGSSWFVL